MDCYQDVTLLPDPEFTPTILMNALYSKLHRALVTLKMNSIGVSFPEYQLKPKNLGGVLRIHGSQDALKKLQAIEWLTGMRDYTVATGIQTVPSIEGYQSVSRRQYKTNAERLRRRRMKRKDETYEQAFLAIPDSVERKPDLPFLTVRSSSTGQTFCMFINQVQKEEQVDGEFSAYGLSHQTTVPRF